MQNDTIAHHPAPEHGKHRRREGWREVASTITLVLIAPLIAVLLMNFVFQSYEVEGQSMETTLKDNDRLVVWKLGKTWGDLTNSGFMPNRGDVIIFHKPANTGVATEGDRQLIKRVIGLPGDRLVINRGTVTIYNTQHPEGFQPDEDLGYDIATEYTDGTIDEVIKPGHIFVMGDNRGNSQDSRSFGQLSTDKIVGSLAARIYPLNKIGFF